MSKFPEKKVLELLNIRWNVGPSAVHSAQHTAHTQMEISVEIFLDGKNEQTAYFEQAK